ncbi:MAG: cytochrome b/b6 domain-containing protein [Hyphomicrobiales bacterium]|nr:cytochrome b/b6 domain-containing protein [Hyphomicrobiales bacterium]
MSHVTRYHPVLVIMHWGLAFLIIVSLGLGALVLAHLPNSDPAKVAGLRAHMVGGVAILALTLLRLIVRSTSAHPAPARTGHPFLDTLARVSHRMFYPVVFMMAGSGLALAVESGALTVVFGHQGALPADFWIFTPRSVHYLVSRVLMALIALHVAGALYHTFVLRDGLLRRLWFGRRVATASAALPSTFNRRIAQVKQ